MPPYQLLLSFSTCLLPLTTIDDDQLESTDSLCACLWVDRCTTDDKVEELYGDAFRRYYEYHGVKAHIMVLPGEEGNKRIEAVDDILEQLTAFGLRRREPIIAVGGGVILDIVGMAANLYRRGVPYIRCVLLTPPPLTHTLD